jgi:hypothetical protein
MVCFQEGDQLLSHLFTPEQFLRRQLAKPFAYCFVECSGSCMWKLSGEIKRFVASRVSEMSAVTRAEAQLKILCPLMQLGRVRKVSAPCKHMPKRPANRHQPATNPQAAHGLGHSALPPHSVPYRYSGAVLLFDLNLCLQTTLLKSPCAPTRSHIEGLTACSYELHVCWLQPLSCMSTASSLQMGLKPNTQISWHAMKHCLLG